MTWVALAWPMVALLVAVLSWDLGHRALLKHAQYQELAGRVGALETLTRAQGFDVASLQQGAEGVTARLDKLGREVESLSLERLGRVNR